MDHEAKLTVIHKPAGWNVNLDKKTVSISLWGNKSALDILVMAMYANGIW